MKFTPSEKKVPLLEINVNSTQRTSTLPMFLLTVFAVHDFSPLRVLGLRVETPVDDVEEQVGQRKQDPGVGVDHVAVAHDEAEVPL